MADQASDSIVIGADKASVMKVIADFESYPQWVDMVKQAEILGTDDEGRATQVRFVLDAGIIKDEYVLAYDWSRPDSLSWHLVQSKAMKSQDGVYRLAESGGSTTVTYDLALDLKMPVLGAFKRKGQKVIIDTALKGLKKRVESGS
jgi:ribosome-associated toxin RatA of RatAB toxin-antitoxin module